MATSTANLFATAWQQRGNAGIALTVIGEQ